MQVLVLQNHGIGPSGLVGQRLTRHNVGQVTVHAWDGQEVPDEVGSYAGMVVLGGAQFAGDFETWPYLGDEAALIRRFAEADRPVLGVCLGAQLVARAHGATVRKHHQLEIGYSPLELTADAATDPLFRDLQPLPQMQWHYDTFDVPNTGVLLAKNDLCTNQAIRVGRAHYGVQFHCEADPTIIRGWISDDPGKLERDHPGAIEAIGQGIEDHADDAPRFGSQLIDRWIDLL